MSFLVLCKGGVRKWQIEGFSDGPAVVNGIPVPPGAIFSARVAAVFASREDAERAIVTTLAYRRAQEAAGNPGFEDIPGIETVVIEVP